MKYTGTLKFAVKYLIAGLLWIYFSDTIVAFFFRSKEQQLFYQTSKGFLYVISTAVLLFILMRNFYDSQLDKLSELRQRQYTLQESESRYHTLFAESPVANIVFDATTAIIQDANNKALTFLGLSRDSVLGKTVSELLPQLPLIHSGVASNRSPDTDIMLYHRADGSTITLEITSYDILLKGVKCVLLLCNDVTEREEAVNKLKENQRRLIAAQKIAKIGYWQFFLHTGDMYWSDEVYEIWGVDKDGFEVSYQAYFNSIHPADRHLLPTADAPSPDVITDIDIEHRIVLPDGTIKWVHEKGSFKHNEADNTSFLEGTVQDITAQKLMSLSLQQNLQRYNYLTMATSDAIWDWDVETDTINWSDSSGKLLLDIHSGPHNKRAWDKHISAEDQYRILSSLTNAVLTDVQYWSDEYRCLSADNSYIYVRNICYILRNEAGEALRVIGAIKDITEKKKDALQSQLLAEISNAFSQDLSLEESLTAVLNSLVNIGNFNLAETWIVGREKKQINLIAYSADANTDASFYADDPMPDSFGYGQGLPGRCWEIGTMLHCDNISNNPHFVRSPYAIKAGITSMYAIPLKHNHELLGVVMLGLMQNSLDSLIVTRLLDSFHSHLASEIRRKQTELELNQLFEFAPDIVCIAGTDGYYKKVNPALTKVLGYTPAELLAHPVSHFIHPEDVGKTVQQIEELKKGNPTIYFENRYITKAGVIKWLAWTATPPSREGLVFSVGKDISDKKELELMLYKATNLANIGAWEINLITNQLNWSSMTRRIHDITDDSYTPSFNDAIQFYCEGHHRNHIIQKVTNAVSKGEKWDIESQIVTVQKQTKWIRSIGEPEFVDGKCIRIVGSFQDIDHIKQAEFLALDALKEKSTILERIGDAFFAVDLNWIITYWNNRAESILGRKREDVLGQNLWDVYIDAVNTPFQTNYEAAMSSGEPRYFEAHYEGTNEWYEVSAFPSPTGLSIFFKDVTERRKYINAIENHNETLRQIAWSQSHEVRSPLVRIMGLVNLVQELELDASAQLIEILDMIVLSANDLDAVIWKINDKTKIK